MVLVRGLFFRSKLLCEYLITYSIDNKLGDIVVGIRDKGWGIKKIEGLREIGYFIGC